MIESLFRQYKHLTSSEEAAATLVLADVMSKQTESVFLSPREVSKKLNISEQQVRDYCNEGRLQSVRCGRKYRIKPEWVQEFLHA